MVLSNTMLHSLFSSVFNIWRETSRGFEPRSQDSESRVLTVTPRGRFRRQLWFQLMFRKLHVPDTRDDSLVRRIGTRAPSCRRSIEWRLSSADCFQCLRYGRFSCAWTFLALRRYEQLSWSRSAIRVPASSSFWDRIASRVDGVVLKLRRSMSQFLNKYPRQDSNLQSLP